MASFFEKLKKGMGIEIPENSIAKDEIELDSGEPDSDLTTETKESKEDEISSEKEEKETSIEEGEKETSVKKRKHLIVSQEKPKKPVKKAKKRQTIVSQESQREEKKEETGPKTEKTAEKFGWQNLNEKEGQLAVDVYETENELVIQTAIAGVKPEDLDISIEGDVFLIKGKREPPLKEEQRNYFCQECYWGHFSRQIIFPVEVDAGRAKAEMEQGILTIRIPKIERKKKIKIELKK